MGEVYKAHDPRLGRFVAIKILLAQKLDDANQRRRFQQEARAASALNHPGIVTVYDVGSERGMDYIAMEFVEGKTLDKLIPRDGFPLPEFLCYSTQAAGALAKAHSARILHRDLKPGNVIVTGEGQVKVLDFGLAKLMQPLKPEEQTAIVAITEEGSVMGTCLYVARTSGRKECGRPLGHFFLRSGDVRNGHRSTGLPGGYHPLDNSVHPAR